MISADPKYMNLSQLRAGELREAIETGKMISEPYIIHEILHNKGEMKREEIISELAIRLNCDTATAAQVFDEHRNKLISDHKIDRTQHGYYIALGRNR